MCDTVCVRVCASCLRACVCANVASTVLYAVLLCWLSGSDDDWPFHFTFGARWPTSPNLVQLVTAHSGPDVENTTCAIRCCFVGREAIHAPSLTNSPRQSRLRHSLCTVRCIPFEFFALQCAGMMEDPGARWPSSPKIKACRLQLSLP